MTKRFLLAIAFVLCGNLALASEAPSFIYQCPQQREANRLPTNFAWRDGEFKQVRQDGRTFTRQVSASTMSQRDVNGQPTTSYSFQLLPQAGEASQDKRDYVAIEVVPGKAADTRIIFFKMATIESGFLSETLFQAWLECKRSGS